MPTSVAEGPARQPRATGGGNQVRGIGAAGLHPELLASSSPALKLMASLEAELNADPDLEGRISYRGTAAHFAILAIVSAGVWLAIGYALHVAAFAR